VIGGPEVQRVALGLALGMEAAEDAFAEVDREGAVVVAGGVVQGAWPAALRAGAAQGIEVAEALEDLLDRHLAAECGEVQRPALAARRAVGLRVAGRLGVACWIDVAAGSLAPLLPRGLPLPGPRACPPA
jgi:hypothetical protein